MSQLFITTSLIIHWHNACKYQCVFSTLLKNKFFNMPITDVSAQKVSTSQGETMETQSSLQAEKLNEGAMNTVAGEDKNIINNLTSISMNDFEKTGQEPAKTTKVAVINGTEQEITLLFPANYSMPQPKDKVGILGEMDKSNLLEVIFNLADPACFMQEQEPLVDINGTPVSSLEGLPNPYVVCQTADTYWRFFLEERLENVRVHQFSSVQEYFKSIGCTMVYSRGFNALELTGVAAQASGNKTYKTIYEFAKKNELTQSAAGLYLGVKLKKEQSLLLSVGKSEVPVVELERTQEEAQKLFDAISACLGKGGAKNRYGIQVANYFVKRYGLEITVIAFNKVPASTITMYKLMGCAEKVSCLTEVLTPCIEWVAERFKKQAA